MNYTKKERWLDVDKICLAMGKSVARNHMFETQKDLDLFIELWQKYLGKMTEIINYQLHSTGWIVLFKTKPSKEIQDAYQEQRNQSSKACSSKTLTDAKKMLSEHFRIFLSQYAKKMNARNGRKGTLVLERFKKFVFERYSDYVLAFEKLINELMAPLQKSAKYQVKGRGMIRRKINIGDLEEGVELWEFIGTGNETFKDILRKYFSIKKNNKIALNSS